MHCGWSKGQTQRWLDIMSSKIAFHSFGTSIQMCCTSTEDMRNIYPSYRRTSRYHITVCPINTAIHTVHWLTQVYGIRKVPVSNTKLKVSHYCSHCCILCIHFLLRHYNCLPATSYLLQATVHTVSWWVKCA